MKRGFITITTVLIILGIVLLIGLSISQLSIGEAQMSLQKFQSSQSMYLANLCVEEALMKLKENSSYQGNETIVQGNGNCTIFPIEGNWIIKITAGSQNQVKKIKIIVSQLSPKIIVDSWTEVADF